MPSARSWSLIGGYTCASQPVTRWPSSRAILARPPMNVPQIPRMCRCILFVIPVEAGIRSTLEDEIHRAHHAKRGPGVVPADRLVHVEHGERHEHRERDHFLHDLELRQ